MKREAAHDRSLAGVFTDGSGCERTEADTTTMGCVMQWPSPCADAHGAAQSTARVSISVRRGCRMGASRSGGF